MRLRVLSTDWKPITVMFNVNYIHVHRGPCGTVTALQSRYQTEYNNILEIYSEVHYMSLVYPTRTAWITLKMFKLLNFKSELLSELLFYKLKLLSGLYLYHVCIKWFQSQILCFDIIYQYVST